MTTEAELKVRVRAAGMGDREASGLFLSRAASEESIEQFDVLGFLQAFVLPVAQVDAGQLFIAKRGLAIIGLASAVFGQAGGNIEIDALLIDPTVDRVVVGTKLTEAVSAFAKRVGASVLDILATESNKNDLIAIGFGVLGIDEAIEATVAYRMRKEI